MNRTRCGRITMTDYQLQEQFTAEIIALEEAGAGLPFVFRPSEAFMLLSVLQLALRHPHIGQTAALVQTFARELAENIEGRISKGGPAITEIARRGWKSEYGVKR